MKCSEQRTLNETTKLVEKTINEIGNHKERFSSGLVDRICEKNNISEVHIRNVAQWPQKITHEILTN